MALKVTTTKLIFTLVLWVYCKSQYLVHLQYLVQKLCFVYCYQLHFYNFIFTASFFKIIITFFFFCFSFETSFVNCDLAFSCFGLSFVTMLVEWGEPHFFKVLYLFMTGCYNDRLLARKEKNYVLHELENKRQLGIWGHYELLKGFRRTKRQSSSKM